MQGMTADFTAKNPDVTVKWVTLEENVLRQRVTTDIATKGGQFDVLTIGTTSSDLGQEGPAGSAPTISAPTTTSPPCCPRSRCCVGFRQALRCSLLRRELDDHCIAPTVPEGGLTMPESPPGLRDRCAKKLTDKSAGVYGICLRARRLGREHASDAMANSYGARWFDEKWQPQFDKPE